MAEEKNWWENYSPIPLENVPKTLRSTLTPKEVVVVIGKNSWIQYFRLIFRSIVLLFAVCCSVYVLCYLLVLDRSAIQFSIIGIILLFGINFTIKLFMLRRRVIVVTDQRILGAFDIKVFSTSKVDLPLRSVDSFEVDDNLFGNIFGYTNIKLLSRSSTYIYKWITKDSCQSIKNAYYDWDSKQS